MKHRARYYVDGSDDINSVNYVDNPAFVNKLAVSSANSTWKVLGVASNQTPMIWRDWA